MVCALLRISILKTILFNLHYFGRAGLEFPVLVGKNFIFKKLRGGKSRIISNGEYSNWI